MNSHVVLSGTAMLAEYSSSSSGSNSLMILAAPFVLGAIVAITIYSYYYRRYRNIDKSYRFEQETAVRVTNVQAFDNPGRRENGVRRSITDGRNSGAPRERVRRVPLG